MQRANPVVRIAAGLAALTCSIVLALDLAGMLPRPPDEEMAKRLRMCEALAAQAAAAAATSDLASVRLALVGAVRTEPTLVSAGLRGDRQTLLVTAGDHRTQWQPTETAGSTATHVRVPIQRNGREWATLEVRFREVDAGGWVPDFLQRPELRLVGLIGAIGFVAYWLYMRRTLRHLDPSAVIPTRVQAALDVMTEGVLLLDEQGRVVLANAGFAERMGGRSRSLLGVHVSDLGFEPGDSSAPGGGLPWNEALREGRAAIGMPLRFHGKSGEERVFAANSSPVLDGWSRPKGAIVTFDDVTELEHKTRQLEEALAKLEKSQDEIRLQNEELELLARRDPLTGVANRRAFMDWIENAFEETQQRGRELSCVMVDIDHFKRVNDAYGHAAGDEVLRRVAELLASEVHDADAVGRYGGEEFCIALAGASIEDAWSVAERMRRQIDSPGFARVSVTASFGVASTAHGAMSAPELIDRADQALYAAKHAGRNRVSRIDQL